jgi:hypothetical protein
MPLSFPNSHIRTYTLCCKHTNKRELSVHLRYQGAHTLSYQIKDHKFSKYGAEKATMFICFLGTQKL